MIIKGTKVRLRPIRLSDAPRYVRWMSDPSVNKYLTTRSISLREEKKWIRNLRRQRTVHHAFAIDTIEGAHIGSVGLRILPAHKNAELGIMIGDKRYWNKGYGSDAMRVILRYGFDRLQLHRIGLKVYSYNPRAYHVYKRFGFKKEGVGRQAILLRGRYYDDVHMGLLRSEWIRGERK